MNTTIRNILGTIAFFAILALLAILLGLTLAGAVIDTASAAPLVSPATPTPTSYAVPTSGPDNQICFIARGPVPLYDGPDPWRRYADTLASGEAVKSYDHPVYVSDDWRYVYNGTKHGWARSSGLLSIQCAGS